MTYDDHEYDEFRKDGCGKHKRSCWCFQNPHGDEEFAEAVNDGVACICEVQNG